MEWYAECKDKVEADRLERILSDLKCNILGKTWISLYNNYVRYDYEPFCPEGFKIVVTYEAEVNTANFVTFEMNKRSKQIDFLERCARLNSGVFYNV